MNNFRNVRKRLFGQREIAPCFWCLDPLTLDDSTLDHIVSRGEGGKLTHKDEGNVVLSCSECNNLRAVLQNVLRTKRSIQNARSQWPNLTLCELSKKVKRLKESLKRKQPNLEDAEREFQKRCKIDLRLGVAGVIYPLDPVPKVPKFVYGSVHDESYVSCIKGPYSPGSLAVRQMMFNGRETVPCFWCYKSLIVDDSAVDHIIGKAEGGKHIHEGRDNIVLACAKCNQLRAAIQGCVADMNYLLKDLQRYSEQWPVTPQKQKALNRYLSISRRREPKKEMAEKEFRERCKIKLRMGKCGMIYPDIPIPELPEEVIDA